MSADKAAARARIVVADDHPIFREGLIKLLQARTDFEIVGTANDGDEVVPLVRAVEPDVLLLDLAMPRMSGLLALREVKGLKTAVRIVVLTAAIERPDIVTALQLGA